MTLYVTDLDGTLLRPDASISDKTAEIINGLIEKGVLFTYSTARSFLSAAPLVSKLNLSCPAVSFNGVFIIDPKTGRHIAENILSDFSLKTAVDFFNREDIAPLVYAYIDGKERISYLESRAEEFSSYIYSRKNDKRLRPVSTREQLFEGRIFYFTLINPNTDFAALDEVFSRENGFAVNFMHDSYTKEEMWYEIFSKSASKAGAVLSVAELLKADRLVCFGDNMNDISMLKAADLGVAVSNAYGELKAVADVIIGSNEQDAVAEFILEDFNKENPTVGDKFNAAVEKALNSQRGLHGSVGTQNEKIIHSALKNYYIPDENLQEIRVGGFIADGICGDRLIEIQTRDLYRLKDKLKYYTKENHVTIIYPMEIMRDTVFVDENSGEIISNTPRRKLNRRLKLYEELYSIREFLTDENITVIIAKLKTQRQIFCKNGKIPDLKSRNSRRKTKILTIPTELNEEISIALPHGLRKFLPEKLPEKFTRAEFLKAANEPKSSLLTEVLRAAGIIEKIGNIGRKYVYSIKQERKNYG